MSRLLTLIAAIILSIVAVLLYRGKIATINRLQGNIEALTTSERTYKTKAGNSASQVSTLRLKADELERMNSSLIDKVRDMRIPIKEVASAGLSSSITRVDTLIANRIVYKDTGLREAVYKDAHNSITCLSYPDSARFSVLITDTITIVEHVKYKRFLGFRTRKVKSRHRTIANVNRKSHLKLEYSVQIER